MGTPGDVADIVTELRDAGERANTVEARALLERAALHIEYLQAEVEMGIVKVLHAHNTMGEQSAAHAKRADLLRTAAFVSARHVRNVKAMAHELGTARARIAELEGGE